MQASILAISTAVPSFAFQQEMIANKLIDIFSLKDEKALKIKQLYENSAITTRYSIIPDFQKERSEWHFWGKEFPHVVPGMAQRNDCYKKEAPKLALEAAKQALLSWGGSPKELTHIISVSCTGVIAPGIEFELMQELDLHPSIQRLGINFMGCFGAFKGLSVAQSFAQENPHHRILLVCTELCSLHFQQEQTPDNILANSLFSDGAAAIIVGGDPRPFEKPLWNIIHQQSFALANTAEKMKWEASDQGFVMKLSHTVPVLLGRHIKSFAETLLRQSYRVEDCDWAIHPGGKSILQAVEKALNLAPEQTTASWKTLANYGNMSSSTFIFVLAELLKSKRQKGVTAGIGFGPGLSIEGILLKAHHDL